MAENIKEKISEPVVEDRKALVNQNDFLDSNSFLIQFSFL